MFRSGDRIGPYTLVNKLGKGAFGVVWLAERRTQITTTNVAIKIPLDEEISIETIKNEADLWVRASGHPNILPIIEADIHGEHIIIASEYAPDGSLDAWLKQNGKAPSIESAVEIVSGILAGLEHLHSRNIIHRDLKPANILFQGNTPRLADFGISRVLKSTSQSSNIMGTPSYMAPEAFDGKRNEQTDIWSVGVIFYQLLAGHLPYREEDITSLVGAILMRNPEPLPREVPKPLQNVIARALAKDINIRYKTAAEMRSAMRNPHKTDPNFQPDKSVYTVQSPVNTMPPQSVHLQSEKKSNAPHLIYAIAGLLAVVIIVSGLYFLSRSSETNNSTPNLTNNSTNKVMNGSSPIVSSQTPVNPSPITSSPTCVVSYTSGSCWTINPSTVRPCSNLDTQKPSVNISQDGSSATVVVPANIAQGVKAENGSGQKLFLREGDWFDISAEGQISFSSDHPCAGTEGVRGWYDPFVDSPFKQNVGGLEFSIGSLQTNRFFVGSYYKDRAETDGIPIFRVIDRLTGYGGTGSFRVIVRKISSQTSLSDSKVSTQQITLLDALQKYKYENGWTGGRANSFDASKVSYYPITSVNINGNSVTMKYAWKSGILNGTISGNDFTGTWTQENGSGKINLHFTDDFSRAQGNWTDTQSGEEGVAFLRRVK
jgi:serine/threonine protein kinase